MHSLETMDGTTSIRPCGPFLSLKDRRLKRKLKYDRSTISSCTTLCAPWSALIPDPTMVHGYKLQGCYFSSYLFDHYNLSTFGCQGALHHLLISPPADPPAPAVKPPARLPYPANQEIYDDNLRRNKCDLLSGSNTQNLVSFFLNNIN